jgi:hypothetical protein
MVGIRWAFSRSILLACRKISHLHLAPLPLEGIECIVRERWPAPTWQNGNAVGRQWPYE